VKQSIRDARPDLSKHRLDTGHFFGGSHLYFFVGKRLGSTHAFLGHLDQPLSKFKIRRLRSSAETIPSLV
jgi:hypothetical protein